MDCKDVIEAELVGTDDRFASRDKKNWKWQGESGVSEHVDGEGKEKQTEREQHVVNIEDFQWRLLWID